jgi:hypothetical protein
MTGDIIAEYCFGFGENYIEAPGFNAVVVEVTDALADNMHITLQAQWLPQLLDRLPDRLIESVFGPGMAKINEMKRVSRHFFAYFLTINLVQSSFVSERSKIR